VEKSLDKETEPSRQRIITAARRLMAEKGIKQTTLADIARNAQISQRHPLLSLREQE